MLGALFARIWPSSPSTVPTTPTSPASPAPPPASSSNHAAPASGRGVSSVPATPPPITATTRLISSAASISSSTPNTEILQREPDERKEPSPVSKSSKPADFIVTEQLADEQISGLVADLKSTPGYSSLLDRIIHSICNLASTSYRGDVIYLMDNLIRNELFRNICIEGLRQLREKQKNNKDEDINCLASQRIKSFFFLQGAFYQQHLPDNARALELIERGKLILTWNSLVDFIHTHQHVEDLQEGLTLGPSCQLDVSIMREVQKRLPLPFNVVPLDPLVAVSDTLVAEAITHATEHSENLMRQYALSFWKRYILSERYEQEPDGIVFDSFKAECRKIHAEMLRDITVPGARYEQPGKHRPYQAYVDDNIKFPDVLTLDQARDGVLSIVLGKALRELVASQRLVEQDTKRRADGSVATPASAAPAAAAAPATPVQPAAIAV